MSAKKIKTVTYGYVDPLIGNEDRKQIVFSSVGESGR